MRLDAICTQPRIVSWRTCFNAATLTRPQVYPGVISRIMGFPYAFHPLRYIVNSFSLSLSLSLSFSRPYIRPSSLLPPAVFRANFSSRFPGVGSCFRLNARAGISKYINDSVLSFFCFSFFFFKRRILSRSHLIFFSCSLGRGFFFKRIEGFKVTRREVIEGKDW